MSNSLQIAQESILSVAGLVEDDLNKVLDQLHGNQIDAGDIYFQLSRLESWSLEDRIVKDGVYNIEQGVGIRAISGEKTGFAYSDEILLPAMLEAAKTARAISHSGPSGAVRISKYGQAPVLYDPLNPLVTLSEKEKIAFLEMLDTEARRLDPRVKQVMVNLVAAQDVVLVIDSEGQVQADVRPLVWLNVTAIVEDGGHREQGSAGGGGRRSYQYLVDDDLALGFAKEAVRQAITNLDAVPAPAGAMPVVLGPGWPGVLLHEAVGHGLEGDFNRKGTSAFTGRVGEKVASELCTVVDDGTLAKRRGSLNVDDEGVPSQCTTLIENGILKGYLQDKLNARLMGVASTGNGRRESYAHLPMPRMTNTYMLAGKHAPEEIIASVDKGLYAVNFGGGQVDITSGKFVFSASEAYLIENGKVTQPVKGATLVGSGPEVLTRVSMVGNDLELDAGVGVCGKEGQSVPVGVGQPTLKVDELTVGGTSA